MHERAARNAIVDPADGLPPEIWEEPMAESPEHFDAMTYLVAAFRWFLRDHPDASVEGNIALQYDPRDLRRHVAPDVLVAVGARSTRALALPPSGLLERRSRRSYALWVEGRPPDLVIEVTSGSTRDNDLGDKLDCYRDTLHVREYVLFDPFGEFLSPRLQAYRRREHDLVPVAVTGEQLPLETLELDLVATGTDLRLRDRRTGEVIRSYDEEARARVELAQRLHLLDEVLRETEARAGAEARAREAAEARAHAAEAQIAALEAELQRLRGQ